MRSRRALAEWSELKRAWRLQDLGAAVGLSEGEIGYDKETAKKLEV